MSNVKAQSSNNGKRQISYFGIDAFGFDLTFEIWH
jgi:hypothetical protein